MLRPGVPIHLLCAAFAAAAETIAWSYDDTGPEMHGQEDWAAAFSGCNGQGQSPINVVPKDALIGDDSQRSVFYCREIPAGGYTLENNQFTVKVIPSNAGACRLRSQSQSFFLDHIHFHIPSEHTLGGNRYDFEVHLVHYDAVKKNAGVVGLLFNATGNHESRWLSALLANMPSAPMEPSEVAKGKTYASATVRGTTDIPPLTLPHTTGYVQYSGSLTTPPCTEPVSWFVVTEPQAMSRAQLETYKSAFGFGGKHSNARHTMPTNGRLPLVFPAFRLTEERPEADSWSAQVHEPRKSAAFAVITLFVMVGVVYVFYQRYARSHGPFIRVHSSRDRDVEAGL
ncbi:Alpha carbonic anhydrase 3 [Diplonema papillatum]|nr:Alpha carbonic anhydrase 3 [Diplonema papillatum]